MAKRICLACGVQQVGQREGPRDGSGDGPEAGPNHCPICEDARQFVPEAGQQWTTMEALAADHRNEIRAEAAGVWSLRTEPRFAIGQRAFLIRAPEGNILWDCVTLLDAATRDRVAALGGIRAIAISHPHYYSAIAEWGRAFGAPVYLHADDAEWVQEPDDALRFWGGETLALGGATLVRCGGHFTGASVLHAPFLNDGGGTLFSGDTIQVVPDRQHVSFMRSYPNLIPLDAETVRRIAAAVEPYAFETVFGAFAGRTIRTGGKQAVRRSAERYVAAISPPPVARP